MVHWKALNPEKSSLIGTIQQLHRVSQVMAMVSHAFLPHRQDDSQNNFDWIAHTNTLEGRWIEEVTVQVKLDIPKFELIVDAYDTIEKLQLSGKTTDKIIEWVKKQLSSIGLDPNKVLPITHYSVPQYAALQNIEVLTVPSQHLLNEWSGYLTNTQILLKQIQEQFKWASEIRVWPHHFDMGLYIPVERDSSGSDTQSVGVGLAIPDPYSPEPYFYINHWSKESITYPEVLPEVRFGYWNQMDWKGLILPASALWSQNDQEYFVQEFFNSGIRASLRLLNQEASETTA